MLRPVIGITTPGPDDDKQLPAFSLPTVCVDAVCVQWHPEMQVAEDTRQRRLFERYVARARDGRR